MPFKKSICGESKIRCTPKQGCTKLSCRCTSCMGTAKETCTKSNFWPAFPCTAPCGCKYSCTRGSRTSRKLQLMLLGKLSVHGIASFFSLCSVIHTSARRIFKDSHYEVAFAIKGYLICKQTQAGCYLAAVCLFLLNNKLIFRSWTEEELPASHCYPLLKSR